MQRLSLILILALVLSGCSLPFRRAEESKPLRFFVVGDNHGPKPVYKQLLEKAKTKGADFVVNVADLTEHGTSEEIAEVRELEDAVGLTVHHVIGSHDIKSDSSRGTWRSAIGEPYRTFAVGDARFILLDNADRTVGFSEEELRWLEEVQNDNTSRRTFLFYHRPFGLPLEGVFGDDETPASRKTNDQLRAIIRRSPPTMIFSSHLHTYLPYTLEGVPAYVTGGGGDPAQAVLGGSQSNFFHGMLVTASAKNVSTEVIRATEDR